MPVELSCVIMWLFSFCKKFWAAIRTSPLLEPVLWIRIGFKKNLVNFHAPGFGFVFHIRIRIQDSQIDAVRIPNTGEWTFSTLALHIATFNKKFNTVSTEKEVGWFHIIETGFFEPLTGLGLQIFILSLKSLKRDHQMKPTKSNDTKFNPFPLNGQYL